MLALSLKIASRRRQEVTEVITVAIERRKSSNDLSEIEVFAFFVFGFQCLFEALNGLRNALKSTQDGLQGGSRGAQEGPRAPQEPPRRGPGGVFSGSYGATVFEPMRFLYWFLQYVLSILGF